MNLGTFVVLAALIAVVSAIIGSWIRAHRAGRHVGCEQCGGCSCGCADTPSCKGRCGNRNADYLQEASLIPHQ